MAKAVRPFRLCTAPYLATKDKRQKGRRSPATIQPLGSDPCSARDYALKELPHPHVDFTFGLLNLKPEPSIVST